MISIKMILTQYIKEQLATLRYAGQEVHLKNVYPDILEDIIGNDDIYELNGYNCDYEWETEEYYVSGCMRFGIATIMLKGEIKNTEAPTEEVKDISTEIPDDTELNTYYFTFGYGQSYDGYYQPIKAYNMNSARRKMMEIYGREWAFEYDEKTFIFAKEQYMPHIKPFKVVIAE